MRVPVGLFVGLGLLSIPAALAGGSGPGSAVSLSVSSYRVLFGHSVTLSGRLQGGRVGDRSVFIDGQPYGGSQHHLATVRTNGNGGWSYKASPTIQTTFQARVGATASPPLTIGVAPAVSVTELGNGRLRVRIRAAHAFEGRLVQLQSRTSGGGWMTVDRKRLSSASVAVLTPKVGNSTLRIAMSVNQAGAGYLGALSHALVYRPKSLTLLPSTFTVLYGHRVTLFGQLVNGKPGQHVAIMAHPYGRPAFTVGTVSTGEGGRFRVTATPTILTRYRAELGKAQQSNLVVVDVRPTIVVRELDDGRIYVHVASASFTRGREVVLQRLAGTKWQTLAKRPLQSNSTTTFTIAPPPGAMVRVAISINQAGVGYVGSTSHPISYRAPAAP